MPVRSRRNVLALVAGALVLAACGSAGSNGPSQGSNAPPPGSTSTTAGAYGTLPAASGTPVKGGTITYPVIEGSQPTWILPMEPGADLTVGNASFENLLYRPLYWTAVGNRPVLNYPLSLAGAPVYSHGNKTVTINMSHNYKWSDGHPVDGNDVLFFINLLRAAVKENASNFGNYTPGNFPDNVVSATSPSTYQVVLKLDKAYNPNWFTETQLTLINPMPSTSWSKSSAGGQQLDASNPANAKAIYDFLAPPTRCGRTWTVRSS
jgi:peptide/nickel transport system substrate-binding protein